MTVANSREERGKAIAQLAGMGRQALLHELVTWTVTADEIADESRDLRVRRGESRTMLELIAAELRNRRSVARPEVVAEAGAA